MVTKEELINSYKEVYDPEVSVNVYDLGLVYEVDVTEEGKVDVLMTLTSPFCPAGDEIIGDIVAASYGAGATDVNVNITFQPEWGPDKISEEGKLELGLL